MIADADEEEPGDYASPPCFLHELDPGWPLGEAPRIGLRRAYAPPGEGEGWRVLVDRVWPRGVSREALAIDAWAKELAPSAALRRWFGHQPARWEEFRRRYAAELAGQASALAALSARCRAGPVTLVYGARDTEHNNAVALREYLLGQMP